MARKKKTVVAEEMVDFAVFLRASVRGVVGARRALVERFEVSVGVAEAVIAEADSRIRSGALEVDEELEWGLYLVRLEEVFDGCFRSGDFAGAARVAELRAKALGLFEKKRDRNRPAAEGEPERSAEREQQQQGGFGDLRIVG